MKNKVSWICTTYRRATCVERIIYQYYQQTYKNKELIIFNTDTENPITLDFIDDTIIVINNNTDYETGLTYTNRGQICRDATSHASGYYFMLADDDDIYLPWYIEQAVDGIKLSSKDAWKPEKSFFANGGKIDLVKNTLEASVIVKTHRIKEIGFNIEKTGCEGLTWYNKLKDEQHLDENNKNYIPSYCFNWSDPPQISGHKQSGNIDNPNNFENHKLQSKDPCIRPLSKTKFSSTIYFPYYSFLINNIDSLNKEFFDKYAYKHIQNINPTIKIKHEINNTEVKNNKFDIEDLFRNKPKSIHDIIPSEFFTKYDNWDYVWSGNCFEWYYALSKIIQPKSFMEIGVRFGFSFLPTLLGSTNLEYALGWDLETYGNNEAAKENIKKYYTGNCIWELQHIDSQQMSELPQFFDLVSIDGCHDYECKIHDLNIVSKNSLYTIIDDYDYHPQVRDAVTYWMKNNIEKIEWSLYIPSFRGTQLIRFKQ